MKETESEELSSASPSCCLPPGSHSAAPPAEAPGCQELEENRDMEKVGVLTAEVVSSCVSNLGRFGSGLHHLYHHLSLPSQDLSDVSVLSKYVHLEMLELPHNKIKDLSCVSHMPYLVTLDASHNEISSFFGFQPPMNLKEVNFSHNRITKMEDLSAYSSLCNLDLDYNSLSEITGLEQCFKLTHLSVAHNKISRISGLHRLPLTHLCLRGNQLERIEGLENLKCLQVLDLSLNRITSLSGLLNLHLLGSINLEKNMISEIQECKHIHDIFLLRDLNLLGNPVQAQPDYRLAVIFLLQHLTVLDQEKVTVEEKVSSVNQFDPPVDVVAARDHMTHLVYQLMQPQGCGKRELAHRLCQELNEYFAHGTSHTTRGPYFGEEDGIDYHFVSEEDFQNMIHMGKFIQTMQYGGHSYGLSREAIEEVAREGLACCVHMELEGVFSLKNSYFEPRYILLIPTQMDKYMGHLTSRDLYTQAQIDMAVSRVELYANTNRQRLGFFDNVIPCDDWEEAYQSLRQVVKEYLLLEEQEEGENNNRGSPDNTSNGHKPEEKLPSPPPSRSGSGALASHSATPINPSDPSYRNYFTKIQAELSPQKNPVNPHLNDASSSSDESRASSALTVPGSAGGLNHSVEPLDISVLGHNLETLKDQTPEATRPGTDLLDVVVSPSSDKRPGSNNKPILPPIPAGRKTPASPSPAMSPRPSPHPAGGEGGDVDWEG
ncbi:Leucine-rich repeat and guanylate kinase domain containing protein [Dissostichus eleginoides]|uniref:Leucine-rich repeat and guanylate kinase domain containing protein n=1 Tax=Dissostichus eleginoides TaxID=100907 RepID=A0AAD9CRK1_DISEL|nr:Leucine-rich repeat and guanylate kinase domain containing protein [Dissostichus eleginoides]